MAQDLDFAEQEIKALERWLKRIVSAMSAGTVDQFGRTLAIDIQSLGLKQDDDIRAIIPSDGLSWGLTVPDSGAHFFVLCGREVALALGQTKEADDDAITARLQEDGFFSEEEKSLAQQAQEYLSTSLIAAAEKDSTAGSLEPTADLLEGSAWTSGKDPIGSEALVVAEVTLNFAGLAESKGLIVITASLIRENFPASLVPSSNKADGPGNLIFYPASSEMKDAILDQMGAETQDCETLAELMRGFVDEDVTGAVIGVNQGEEYILPLLRGMNKLPDCKDKAIVVVLKQPSTANVVRCGRLGLFHVLPEEFSAEDFQKALNE